MTDFIVYECLCSTENATVQVTKRADEAAPTLCPNNTAHTLAGSYYIVSKFVGATPVVTQADGSYAVATDLLQHPPAWTYLALGFSIQIPLATATRYVAYRQILDASDVPMALRAWTGKCSTLNCDVTDKFNLEIVVKGSALGGVDDTNDLVLDQFLRNIHPVTGIQRQFAPPDKSLLIPASAHSLNPALPDTGIFFKVTYTPGVAAGANQWLVFDLEGFEQPA